MEVAGRNQVKIEDELQSVRFSSSFKLIRWIAPETGWLKWNTDDASKGNPDPSSTAFFIRVEHGDLVVAQGSRIKELQAWRQK